MKKRCFFYSLMLFLILTIAIYLPNTFAQDTIPYAVLQGHRYNVNSVAFSPDGSILASGSEDETIRLWNPTTGEHISTLEGHRYNVNSVAFSPDGSILASGSYDGTIWLWNPTTGEHISTLVSTLEGHRYRVNSVAFSPDGSILASGSSDDTIWLWNPTTGEHISTLEGHRYRVNSVAFSPDGSILASGSSDDTVRLWNPTTGEHISTLEGHRYRVNSVAFSPDGSILASGSEDETIRLWNPTTGEHISTLEGHRRNVNSVAFSPDGSILASGSEGETIRLWSPTTGEHISTLVSTLEGYWHNVNSVAFSPDGSILASGSSDGTIWLWKLPAKVSITPFPVESPTIGEQFSINVSITEGETVGGYQLTLGFEPTALRYVSSVNGNYLTESSYFVQPIVQDNSVTLGATNYAKVSNGDGTLATITFAVIDVKESALNLSGVILTDSDGNPLSHLAYGGKIVEPPPVPSTAVVSVTPSPVLSPVRHQQFTLNVDIVGGQNVAAHRLFWGFDGEPLELLSGQPGDYLADGIGNGDGTLFTGTFKVRSVKTSTVSVSGHLIGADGLRYIPTFESATVAEPIFGDVNRDGVVDIRDLVLVASSFSQEVPKEGNPADVTENDLVNIIDLVKVAAVIGRGAAAPPVLSQDVDVALTRADVQGWLAQAQQLNLTDATSQRGILFLQQLLATLTPKETALLPNYPNPFNPETWIPYQLATPADVTVTIYAVDGTVVRRLALGHQPIGIYQGKSRAAYWDGKNALGEPVASGIYFIYIVHGVHTRLRYRRRFHCHAENADKEVNCSVRANFDR